MAPKTPNIPGRPTGSDLETCRGDRNFWMHRLDAKIGLRYGERHRRPNTRKHTGENPHRNGPLGVDAGISGFAGLGGGVRSQIRTGLRPKFPANREINREFYDSGFFEAVSVAKTPVLQRFLDDSLRILTGKLFSITGKSAAPSREICICSSSGGKV